VQEDRQLAPKTRIVRPRLVVQPYLQKESAGTVLAGALADPAVDQFVASAAWLRMSGLNVIAPSIEGLHRRGGHAELLVGLDYRGTTLQGLRAAIDVFDRVYVVHDVEGRTFHPKLYLARGASRGYLLVGSNNLTAGGLGFNYETALVCDLNFRLADDRGLAADVDALLEQLRSDAGICRRVTRSLAARLEREGWLGDERRRDAASRQDVIRRERSADRDDPIFTRGKKAKRSRPIPPGSGQPQGRRAHASRAAVSSDAWWKRLNRTDVQRPVAGNPVGAVRITRPAGYDINPATWFRTELFVEEQWKRRLDHRGNRIEVADVTFDCYLEYRPLGRKRLRLDYGPHRADRSRSTTLLHWDDLGAFVQQRNLTEHYLILERGAGPVHRLTIRRELPC
jgi:hypothetical protein